MTKFKVGDFVYSSVCLTFGEIIEIREYFVWIKIYNKNQTGKTKLSILDIKIIKFKPSELVFFVQHSDIPFAYYPERGNIIEINFRGLEKYVDVEYKILLSSNTGRFVYHYENSLFKTYKEARDKAKKLTEGLKK